MNGFNFKYKSILAMGSCLLLLTSMVSCGQKAKTNVKAKVSILGNLISGSNLPAVAGGIMFFGKNQSTGEFFSKVLTNNTELVLNNGRWDFAAVGWDASGAFVGIQRCSFLGGIGLNGGDININFDLNVANCANPVFGANTTKQADGQQPKGLDITNCADSDGLYDSSRCYKGIFQSYIISFQEINGGAGGVQIGGGAISSSCSNHTPYTTLKYSTNLKMPIISLPGGPNIPITVSGFDGAACSGFKEDFNFGTGPIQAGLQDRSQFSDQSASTSLTLVSDNCASPDALNATPFAQQIIISGVTQKLICTADQFINIKVSGAAADNFIIAADLNFSGKTIPQLPLLATFNGKLIGNDYDLSNMQLNQTIAAEWGIFGTITNATIENINFINPNFAVTGLGTGYYVGILAGRIDNGSNINNVSFDGPILDISGVTTSLGAAGVVSGFSFASANPDVFITNTKIINPVINIGGFGTVGTVIGNMNTRVHLQNTKIVNAILKSSVTTSANIGGAIGTIDGSAFSEVWGLDVDVNIGSAGNPITLPSTADFGGAFGVVNNPQLRLTNIKVTGSINFATTTSRIGGLIGELNGASQIDNIITNVSINSNAVSNVNFIGGVIGYTTSTSSPLNLKALRSFGSIKCFQNCGGLVGQSIPGASKPIYIDQSYSKSNITITASGTASVGGLLGSTGSSSDSTYISKSFAEGSITFPSTTTYIGGLVGKVLTGAQFSILDTYAKVNLESSSSINTTNNGTLFGNLASGSNAQRLVSAGKFLVSGIDAGASTSVIGSTSSTSSLTNCYFITNLATDTKCPTTTTTANAISQINFPNLNFKSDNPTYPWSMNALHPNFDWQTPIELLGEQTLGTHLDPYIISDTDAWNVIKDRPELMTANFKLGADLNFQNGTIPFTPIGSGTNPFKGSFRGNDFSINNVNFTNPSASGPAGIFAALGTGPNGPAASIQDFDEETFTSRKLILNNINITQNSATAAGILAGVVNDAPTQNFNAIRISGVTINGGSLTGGSGAEDLGGAIGTLNFQNQNTRIENISSSADILSSTASSLNVGGIIGKIEEIAIASPVVQVRNLKYTGSITCPTSSLVGGIIGKIQPQSGSAASISFEDLLFEGDVSGGQYVGGIFGQFAGTSAMIGYSKGMVTSNIATFAAGGVAGNIDYGTISGMYSTAKVTALGGGSIAAGFVATINSPGAVSNSYVNTLATDIVAATGTVYRFGFTGGGTVANSHFVDDSGAANETATKLTSAQIANAGATNLTPGGPWFFDGTSAPKIFPEVFPEYFDH